MSSGTVARAKPIGYPLDMRPFILVGSLIVAGCETPAAAPAVRSSPIAQSATGVALAGGSGWSCPFPAQADADKIDDGVVTLYLTVSADGTPKSVRVAQDPGHGFGAAASRCALAKRYRPALDRTGTPIVGTAVVNVRFHRPPPVGEP